MILTMPGAISLPICPFSGTAVVELSSADQVDALWLLIPASSAVAAASITGV
jgi:glutaredoxin-related protein